MDIYNIYIVYLYQPAICNIQKYNCNKSIRVHNTIIITFAPDL